MCLVIDLCHNVGASWSVDVVPFASADVVSAKGSSLVNALDVVDACSLSISNLVGAIDGLRPRGHQLHTVSCQK